MHLHSDVTDETESSRTVRLMSEWYALNPDVSRLWVYEAARTRHGDALAVHVVVALAPVCDSDDISPIWLAKCTGWHKELQRLIGHDVRLDWFDGDTEAVPCAEVSEHARACLTSIGWRDQWADGNGDWP